MLVYGFSEGVSSLFSLLVFFYRFGIIDKSRSKLLLYDENFTISFVLSLCFLNIFFLLLLLLLSLQLFGIALVAVGAGFLLKYEEIVDAFKDAKISVVPIVFIVIGSLIFLIAFFGCCGAILESSWMVSTVRTHYIHNKHIVYVPRIACAHL